MGGRSRVRPGAKDRRGKDYGVSNFIKRNLADKAVGRGSKIETLLAGLQQQRERDAMRAEQQQEETQDQKPMSRGLPRGFEFRRRMNH